jgi:hypothetical protein
LNPATFAGLTTKIQRTFGSPLSSAIETATGDTLGFSKAIIAATNYVTTAMSIDFVELLEKAYQSAEKENTRYQRADGISLKQLREIEREIIRRYPLFKTEYQSFDPSSTSNLKTENFKIGSTLDDKIQVYPELKLIQPSDVSGMPYLVIGLGDGRMMQIVAADPTGPSQDLLVFDGAHMKISDIVGHSEKYNKAIFEAWQSNIANIVVPSFLAALSRNSANLMLFSKVTKYKDGLGLDALATDLLYGAKSIDVAHSVLSKYQISVDQMAAGMTGYLHNPNGKLLVDIGEVAEEIKSQLDNTSDEIEKTIKRFFTAKSDKDVKSALTEVPVSDLTLQKLFIHFIFSY